ncbi:MAG: capsid protein, partial [Bacillota bacterium]|nr:capsid protein [Bacillota bacterium]
MAATPLNYAAEYAQALANAFPYVLNFGELYSTPNNNVYRWDGANTIKIPSITTTGRTDANRDVVGLATRNYDNSWET